MSGGHGGGLEGYLYGVTPWPCVACLRLVSIFGADFGLVGLVYLEPWSGWNHYEL